MIVGLVSFQTLPVFARSKTNLPFIKTKIRHMHRYLRILQCLYNVWQKKNILLKSVSMQQHFEQFVAKQRRLERKSEVELLRFDSENRLSLQGQFRAQFKLIYAIEFRHIRWYLNQQYGPYAHFWYWTLLRGRPFDSGEGAGTFWK